jgi:hypothetical protein
MKKLIAFILLFVSSFNALADCDWNTGITPGPNHTFIYSEACHLAVGQLVSDSKTKDQQIADLTQAISLDKLALKESDARTQLWITTSNNELDRLNKISNDEKHNEVLFFALGVATTFLAAYGAAKLVGK